MKKKLSHIFMSKYVRLMAPSDKMHPLEKRRKIIKIVPSKWMMSINKCIFILKRIISTCCARTCSPHTEREFFIFKLCSIYLYIELNVRRACVNHMKYVYVNLQFACWHSIKCNNREYLWSRRNHLIHWWITWCCRNKMLYGETTSLACEQRIRIHNINM